MCLLLWLKLLSVFVSGRTFILKYVFFFFFFFFLVFLINVVMWFPSLCFKVIHISSHVLNAYNIYFVLLFWLRIKSDIQNPCRTLGSTLTSSLLIRTRGYKTVFMMNSVEHEILNAHKYKNIFKKWLILGSDKPKMLFSHS